MKKNNRESKKIISNVIFKREKPYSIPEKIWIGMMKEQVKKNKIEILFESAYKIDNQILKPRRSIMIFLIEHYFDKNMCQDKVIQKLIEQCNIIDSQKIKTQDGSYDLDKLTDDQLIKMYELTPETDLSLQEI
tara:strand:- start:142 stop:540 length:399 start_codon:yes stop_codon:yes gene_type:complete